MSLPEIEKYGDEPLGDSPGYDKQNHFTTQVQAVQGSLDDAKRTRRELKPRHVQMMAISGAIGTGLFASTTSQLSSVHSADSHRSVAGQP
jgi:amino acid permease